MSAPAAIQASDPREWYRLSVRDAAQRLGLSTKTIYRAPKRYGGRRTPGGLWRFSEASLQRLMEGGAGVTIHRGRRPVHGAGTI